MRLNIDRHYPIAVGYKILYLFGAVLLFGIATIYTWAASGYDTVVIDSSEFNATKRLWYDTFIIPSLRSRHRNCSAAEIALDDCSTFRLCC